MVVSFSCIIVCLDISLPQPSLTDNVLTARPRLLLTLLLLLPVVACCSDPGSEEELYYRKASNTTDNAKWIVKRGSSRLEGYHSHLHDVLTGNNYSSELAWALISIFNFRWNVKRAIDNAGHEDFGSFKLWDIEAINKLAAELGTPCPHPGFQMKIPQHTTESFGPRYMPPWTPAQWAGIQSDASAQHEPTTDTPPSAPPGAQRVILLTVEPLSVGYSISEI